MLSVQVRGVASGPLRCQRSASAWQRHETLLGYVRIRMNASTCVHLAGNRVHYTYTLAQLPRDSARWRGDAVTSAQAASAHTDSRARPPADPRWTPVIVAAAGTGHDAAILDGTRGCDGLCTLLPAGQVQVRARPPRRAPPRQSCIARDRRKPTQPTFAFFKDTCGQKRLLPSVYLPPSSSKNSCRRRCACQGGAQAPVFNSRVLRPAVR